MSHFKTYGAIAIMIGCFVVIYPRFMHPIVQSAFGYRDPPQKVDNNHGGMPPGHKGSPRGSAEEMRKNIRGPHPGMRAAAEMHRQQGQQGSSRGMMGVVLPMYAVGIILYLAYTLYKVFNKNNAKNEAAMSLGSSRYARERGGPHFQGERDRDRMGFPRDFDGNDDIHNFLHDEEHRHNLEDLLTRVDDKNVSVEEMRILQKRLEETEAQMTRILSAMQSVNANVDRRNTTETDAGDEGRDPDNQEEEDVEEIICDRDPSTKATDRGGADGRDSKEENEPNEQQGDAEEAEEGDQLPEAEGDEQAVDEMMEEKKTDNGDGDEAKESSVRQRNIKTNEQ